MSGDLCWQRDGANWPNHEASGFVRVGNLTWHVQRMGTGSPLLLIHGTGASTHSWRAMLPLLAKKFDVVAIDLPGHGFTTGETSRDLSLDGMASALARLLAVLEIEPRYGVGHSAGAAVLVRMCQTQRLAPRSLVALNGAMLPFPGMAGKLFPALAQVLYLNPVVPRLLSWRAQKEQNVRRLLEGMGSSIDEEGVQLYTRLFRSTRHTRSTIRMMAYWDLNGLAAGLGDLRPHLLLVAGSNDRAIPAEKSFEVKDMLKSARVIVVRGGGHLLHEERPEYISEIIIGELCSGAGTSAPDRVMK